MAGSNRTKSAIKGLKGSAPEFEAMAKADDADELAKMRAASTAAKDEEERARRRKAQQSSATYDKPAVADHDTEATATIAGFFKKRR